jgi:hypothetical protein
MLALGATSPSSRRINQTIIDQLTLLGDLLGAFENLMLQYRVLLLQDLAQSPLLASFLMADAFSVRALVFFSLSTQLVTFFSYG